MNEMWQRVAERIVEGLGVQPGELLQVQSRIDRFDVLLEVLLAVEMAGATPIAEITPGPYMLRLLEEGDPYYLGSYDRHRIEFVRMYDRVLNLQGDQTDLKNLPPTSQGWWEAIQRLEEVEEERRLPVMVAAIPTEGRARQLGMSLGALDEILVPALAVSRDELQAEIDRVLAAMDGSEEITIETGEGHRLTLQLGDRIWLPDDGYIDEEDRERGAIVSNLPAGSVYTTVVEGETEGSIALPKAGSGEGVVFTFRQGRIVEIEAAKGKEELTELFDRHTGEPRRVSHFGIGLNPQLHRALGWIIPDEHIHGNLFLALGENRYMGGLNESSLNIDFIVPGATVRVVDRAIVEEGKVVV